MSGYFIMMYHQKPGIIMPIVDKNENVKLYNSEEKAHEDMKDHSTSQAFGYEVFELGMGSME